MGERGAAAAGQRVHALPGHGDGLGGRQQHLRAVPAEGDDADLVPRRVALLQQRQRCSLSSTHMSQTVVIVTLTQLLRACARPAVCSHAAATLALLSALQRVIRWSHVLLARPCCGLTLGPCGAAVHMAYMSDLFSSANRFRQYGAADGCKMSVPLAALSSCLSWGWSVGIHLSG